MIKKVLFKVLAILPYAQGSTLISILAAIPLVQDVFFRHVVVTMKKLKQELKLEQNVRQLTHRHIVSTSFDPWRIRKLSLMSDDVYRQWVKLKNLSLIKSRHEMKQGVLLAMCHVGMARILPMVMLRENIDITMLETDSYYSQLDLPCADRIKSIEMRSSNNFFLKIVFKAKKVLKSAGVLLMAPDGLRGMGEGTDHAFLDKRRSFFGGFATLAEQTGSAVVLSDITVYNDGSIEVEFSECPDLDQIVPEQLVRRHLEFYVDHLEILWQNDISKVSTRHLNYFLSL